MSSSAPKLPDDLPAAATPDQASEREQRLSKNFDDPVLEDLIPGLVQKPASHPLADKTQPAVGEAPAAEAPKSIVEEAAEAVQELMFEQSANSNPAILLMVPPEEKARQDQDAAIGLEGSTVDEQAIARIEMAEKLFQLVVCEKSFHDLVEGMLVAIMQAIHARAGSILEMDYVQQNYFFRAAIGEGDPEKLKAFRVPLNKGIVGHVAESRRPLLMRDLAEDQMQMKAISMSVGLETKTCMAAPLIVGGQIYGVIEVFNKLDGGFFEERDLEILEEGVRMAAKVLEVRFLMSELLKRAG